MIRDLEELKKHYTAHMRYMNEQPDFLASKLSCEDIGLINTQRDDQPIGTKKPSTTRIRPAQPNHNPGPRQVIAVKITSLLSVETE